MIYPKDQVMMNGGAMPEKKEDLLVKIATANGKETRDTGTPRSAGELSPTALLRQKSASRVSMFRQPQMTQGEVEAAPIKDLSASFSK